MSDVCREIREMNRPKMLNVGVNLAPESGGTFETMRQFVRGLERAGWDTSVLNFSRFPHNEQIEKMQTFPVMRTPVGRTYQWSRYVYTRMVRRVITEADLICVHGIYVHPLLKSAQFAARLGIPYILVPHGSLDPNSLLSHAWRKKLWLTMNGRTLFERSAALLYATPMEQDRSWARGLERRSECIPWPTTLDYPEDRMRARREIETRHGLGPKSRIALFCTRLARVKRPIETIRAFLKEASEDWVLLIVGPASPEVPITQIRRLCAGSAGRCIWTGPVFGPGVGTYYAAADLFVLLSHSENYAYVVAQALARGVPAVVSGSVGLAAYIERWGGGIVARSDSYEDMCGVLGSAMSCSSERLREIGADGQAWVRRELSLPVFSERLNALCRSILEEQQKSQRAVREVSTT